jgi:hypothetical protein
MHYEVRLVKSQIVPGSGGASCSAPCFKFVDDIMDNKTQIKPYRREEKLHDIVEIHEVPRKVDAAETSVVGISTYA